MEKERSKQILSELLSIQSVNGKDDEGRVAEYICGLFVENGIEAYVDRMDEMHANIVAKIRGNGSDKFMVWNGHIDTVPYGDMTKWETAPSVPVEKDGKIYARGASDMKSGLAAMVCALIELNRSKPCKNILFIGSCDEEKGGKGAYRAVEKGLLSDIDEILIGEPTNLNIGLAQKGCLWLEITVKGRTSHGAYPERGINAVEKAYFIAEGIKAYASGREHPLLGRGTAQISMIEGGVAPNMTPDRCRMLMDIRFLPHLTEEDIKAEARRLAETLPEGAEAEINTVNCRRAVSADSTDKIYKEIKRAAQKQGLSPKSTGISYFTDASVFLEQAEEAKVVLFGPGDEELCHQANEYVELEKYYKAIEVLTSYAKEG